MFEAYETETLIRLTEEENNWIKKYLQSLEKIDTKSDFFKFPLEDEVLSTYRNEFLDVIDMASYASSIWNYTKIFKSPGGRKIFL